MDTRLLRELAEDWPAPVVQRVITVAQPVAGADFTVNVPGESTWLVMAVTAQLATSAAVANRVPVLRLTDGTNTLWRLPAPVAITASLTTQISWIAELRTQQAALSANTLAVGIPPLYVQPGFGLSIATSAIDVADQWSSVTVTALEVLTGERERDRAGAEAVRDHVRALIDYATGEMQ